MEELFESLGHIGELSRVLHAFSKKPSDGLSRVELIAISNQTAGITGRYPRPSSTLDLLTLLGLLAIRRNLYFLTAVGLEYLREGTGSLIDPNLRQNRLLLGLILDDSKMKTKVSALFTNFKSDGDGILKVRASVLPAAVSNASKLLQQLQCLRYHDGFLSLNLDFEDIVAPMIQTSAILSEEEFWQRLEAQRLRGKLIEELVLESEKHRLRKLKRPDLADAVLRVSAINVGAGYDIESFEEDGTQRYIEVKSSTGVHLRFEWSLHERTKAEDLGEKYWIYFVPMAHLASNEIKRMIMLRNPAKKIKLRMLLLRSTTWNVYVDTTTNQILETILDKNMIAEW